MKKDESKENYLETIYLLSLKNEKVRITDIADDLCFSKASVSVAVKKLMVEQYAVMDDLSGVTLTKAGLSRAKEVYERHLILSKLLITIGVDEGTAKKDACEIEHIISEKSFDAIKKHVENFCK